MTWLQRYRVRHYLVNSIWILPTCSIALAIVFFRAADAPTPARFSAP